MRGVIVSCGLLLALLLAGCTLETGDDAISDDKPATSLEVESASVRSGRCFSDSDFGDGFCHSVVVAIENTNNRKDFSTNMFNWDGRDADGGVYSSPDVDGPDGIAAGGSGRITLGFDIEEGEVLLTEIHYKSVNTEYWADVPSYQ